ncbi:hypothetical protein ACLQ2R_03335 [Streptosporangium sp. DT93]|uniref:hypothetical protein n=1 Tax=Streptosporangium sp. DT93 TaxID=3393428 RepID=UPI003CF8ED02
MTHLPADPSDVADLTRATFHLAFSANQLHHAYECVTVYAGTERCGLLVMPRHLAWEMAARLVDPPARIADITPEIIRHVRYVLDEDYALDVDEQPTEHLRRVIRLMANATEDELRVMGRAYPAYAMAVAIATGAPTGLEALRLLYLTVSSAAAG